MKIKPEYNRILCSILFIVSIFSSAFQWLVSEVQYALAGWSILFEINELFLINPVILFLFGVLSYSFKKAYFLVPLFFCYIFSFVFWIIHPFLRMITSFEEGLIDFFITGIPSIIIIAVFINQSLLMIKQKRG